MYKIGLIDKSEEKKYRSFENADSKYSMLYYFYMFMVITQIYAYIPFYRKQINILLGAHGVQVIIMFLLAVLPLVCLMLYCFKLQKQLRNKIAVLTDAGRNEKAEWEGLVRYMQDYSKFKEKTVPDLILWEKYLVYATALGIADKVVEQMKAAYPEVFVKEYWENENIAMQYPILDFSMNPIFISTSHTSPISSIGGGVGAAYRTSQTEIARHVSSSGSRWRWAVSQAADGGRWWPDGRNGRQIIMKGENGILN